jgi:hypothetical protein
VKYRPSRRPYSYYEYYSARMTGLTAFMFRYLNLLKRWHVGLEGGGQSQTMEITSIRVAKALRAWRRRYRDGQLYIITYSCPTPLQILFILSCFPPITHKEIRFISGLALESEISFFDLRYCSLLKDGVTFLEWI